MLPHLNKKCKENLFIGYIAYKICAKANYKHLQGNSNFRAEKKWKLFSKKWKKFSLCSYDQK
ncbi:MAG: hypothetical protein DRP41_07095 [Thermodesulfobacteriota bacterium]|nr:MAG: hypothetical protein DRP41_07095 [Thermodesulfobacteriota bacterium]